MRKETRKYLIFGSTSLSLPLLFCTPVFADSSSSLDVTITVPVSCNLTITNDDLSTTINPDNSGTIGTSTITSLCNDASGLAVYAVGYTDNTYGNNYLTSPLGSTYKIHSNVSSGTPSASEWYMTLSAVSGDYAPTIMNQTTGQNPVGNFTEAHIVPTAYTKVAYRNTGTDVGNNATGSSFTATFGAYVAHDQPASTYSGTVKFLLVHPNVLTYNSETGEPATFQPDTLAEDPEMYLQNIDMWKDSIALGDDPVEKVDLRDGQVYKVARYKMNASGTETALWMSNLNLGAESLTVNTLDSTNTHLPADGSKNITASSFATWVKSSQTGKYTRPEFISITASNSETGSATDSYGNKYGTLYNYAAATAGTYAYDSELGVGNAQYDLCPAGWRLPTGGATGEFQAMIDHYDLYDSNNFEWNTGGFEFIQQNLGFALAGDFTFDEANQGDFGYYWSSTFYDEGDMYNLYFDDGYLDAAEYYDIRIYGYSVRCIAQ